MGFLFLITTFLFWNFKQTVDKPDIVVDFSAPIKHKDPFLGFLLSLSSSEPDDSLITPLKPFFWRVIHLDRANKIFKNKSNIHFIIGDVWRIEHAVKGKSPLDDIDRWDKYIKSTISNISKESASKYFIEIWNEPNSSFFWSFSKEKFFQLYAHTVKIIKSYNAKINIGGPGISVYDSLYLADFLSFANKNNVPVDFLTWHELNIEDNIAKIPVRVNEAKKIIENNHFLNDKLENSIYISEYGGEPQQYKLADNFTYLYYLLEANIAGAAKSCWGNGINSNCWNNSIDGLIGNDKKPRAIWYLYKMFSEGIESYYEVKNIAQDVLVLASKMKNSYRILIAENKAGSFGRSKNTKLRLKFNNFNLNKKSFQLYTLSDVDKNHFKINNKFKVNKITSEIIIENAVLLNNDLIFILEIK
jgi:hypothetical protein